jgi:glycosyltransferase involved in cell wall biosynthesis
VAGKVAAEMSGSPRVSVVTTFLNAERFLGEAVASVLDQTYRDWELLLVDDGSTDRSSVIAREYAALEPEKIRCLEHPARLNQGMSAARNLGIHHAQGNYVAFLDADDVWLPQKLAEQVPLLEQHPEAAMLYGNTEYWRDWTGNPEDQGRNFMPELGVRTGTVHRPPVLLPLYLLGRAAVPCTCSVVVRREVLERTGGFEESFPGMYEDQAFYAKVALDYPILVSDACWDRYRQHPESTCAAAVQAGKERDARAVFLSWLERYLRSRQVLVPAVERALRRARWLNSHPGAARLIRKGERLARAWRRE